MAWLDGLLGGADDPRMAGLLGGLSGLGAGMIAAGAPRPLGQPGPTLGDAFGAFGQGRQNALLNTMKTRDLDRQMAQAAAWKDAASGAPTTPEGQRLFSAIPENRRAAIFAMGPEQGMKAWSSLLTQRPVAVSPGQTLVGLDGPGARVPYTPEDFAFRRAGAPSVNVQMKAFGEGMKTAYEQSAKAWQTSLDATRDVARREALFQNAETALEGFRPGIDANIRLKAQQGLAALGLPNNAPAGELLQSVQRQIELANTPRGQGQITENERVLIREMNNLMGATPEGARLLMGATRELDKYETAVARIYTESARKNGGTPNPVEVAEAIQKLPPALSVATSQQMDRMVRQSQGATPSAPPRRVQTLKEIEALPSGAQFIGPDGKTRVKP